MEAKQAWRSAVGQLQLEMHKAAFDTWVRDAQLLDFSKGTFRIGVQNAYARDWLESRLKNTIIQLLTGTLDRNIDVEFVVTQSMDDEEEKGRAKIKSQNGKETSSVKTGNGSEHYSINNRYTFKNFVVGPSNR
ncbi:MAG: chromosomal replication initiator protein DnaA, partial [Anaerolineales bacterium]|nr:chromosomal replication initiator protein DnaA [Anaerolineales bacterium]